MSTRLLLIFARSPGSESPSDLETGEPGFDFAGARSYGRSRTFLLRTGFAHLEPMLDSIAAPAEAATS